MSCYFTVNGITVPGKSFPDRHEPRDTSVKWLVTRWMTAFRMSGRGGDFSPGHHFHACSYPTGNTAYFSRNTKTGTSN